tara:strand:- start:2848 stop:3885 length:1038 start_codon:yes stop_codon:yes gene_type:complete
MAGMFGNRFDVQDALDDRLYKEAYQVGTLSSYGVGQMAAYQDGMMGSPLEAALSDKFSPQMQKQNLLDELQRKHPNPDTVDKLNALANDLFANGLGDMGLKVQEAASQMKIANATVTSANAPKADMFKNLGDTLSNQVLSTQFIDDYIAKFDPTFGVPFDDKNDAHGNRTNYDAKRKRHETDLKNMFSQWANFKQYDGISTKSSIATLMGNTGSMTNDFLEWVAVHGDQVRGEYMASQMMVAEPRSGGLSSTTYVNKSGATVEFDSTNSTMVKVQEEVNTYSLAQVESQLNILTTKVSPEKLGDLQLAKIQMLKNALVKLTNQDEAMSTTTDATGTSVESDWIFD